MTTGVLATPPILSFTLNNGQLAAGGSLLTQVGGVNAATYQDSGLATPLPNPIPLNSRGEISNASGASCQLFLTPNTVYTFTLSDSGGNQVWVASYINGVQISLTQSVIGTLLNPQTLAESLVGVTPTNYAYSPGNVLRYGADPSGSLSSQTAFNNAVSVAIQAQSAMYVPTGVYKLTNALAGNLNFGLRIYGDGAGTSVIKQTTDNHALNFAITNGTQGRLIVEELSIVAALGSKMVTGCAIKLQGYTNNANSPARSLVVQNVIINGQGAADEFKYGIFANGVVATWISGCEIGLVAGSTTSVGLHIESTSTSSSPSLAWDIYGIQIYNGNTSVEIISNQTAGGVQGIHFIGGNLVGANNGVIATNQQGLAVIALPELNFVAVHINSLAACVQINGFTAVFFDDCLIYTSATTGAIFTLTSVQNFEIDVQTACLGATDIPVFSLVGTISATCGNGRISGFFQGLTTGNPVVSISGAQQLFGIRVCNASLNGYSSWLPTIASAPTYIGSIQLDLNTLWPLTSDEIQPTITPSGGVTGGGTLNLTYVQAPSVLVNATAGAITAITPYAGYPSGGQRVILVCNGSGVTISNNAHIRPPGAATFTFGSGSSVEFYQEGPSPFWRAIASAA